MGNKRRKDGFIYEELDNGDIAIVDYDPTFLCNPQKMYYGERTYKKYLDGFKKILECL